MKVIAASNCVAELELCLPAMKNFKLNFKVVLLNNLILNVYLVLQVLKFEQVLLVLNLLLVNCFSLNILNLLLILLLTLLHRLCLISQVSVLRCLALLLRLIQLVYLHLGGTFYVNFVFQLLFDYENYFTHFLNVCLDLLTRIKCLERVWVDLRVDLNSILE